VFILIHVFFESPALPLSCTASLADARESFGAALEAQAADVANDVVSEALSRAGDAQRQEAQLMRDEGRGTERAVSGPMGLLLDGAFKEARKTVSAREKAHTQVKQKLSVRAVVVFGGFLGFFFFFFFLTFFFSTHPPTCPGRRPQTRTTMKPSCMLSGTSLPRRFSLSARPSQSSRPM
jgi:hypothetical protein